MRREPLPITDFAIATNRPANTAAKQNTKPRRNLRYYGYYWVNSAEGKGYDLDKVVDYTNANLVDSISTVKECAARGVQCILQVRWEFFAGSAAPNPIRKDYKTYWDKTADQVAPYIGSVAAFYMIDEPYWNGVSKIDLEKAIVAVKNRFCKTPVMVVFAAPSLKEKSFAVPDSADWLGCDVYSNISKVCKVLTTLKGKIGPGQSLFLVPQSELGSGVKSDEELAELNMQYFKLARAERRVIGLLNFGPLAGSRKKPFPETLKVQKQIGKDITGKG